MNGTKVVTLLGAILATGCAAGAREAALTLTPGASRASTVSELRQRQYCRPTGPELEVEIYPACEAPGAEYGESWVAVEYRADRLIRLQRFEHYDDDERAVERWNQLVERHDELSGPANQDARLRMTELRGLPDGTRSWFAFRRSDGETLVGVYLLTPARAGDPNVLEEIIDSDFAPDQRNQR